MTEDFRNKAATIIKLYGKVKPQDPYSDLGRATDVAHAYQKLTEGQQVVDPGLLAQVVAKLTSFDIRSRTFLQPESSDE
jgi:hypothetical protein